MKKLLLYTFLGGSLIVRGQDSIIANVKRNTTFFELGGQNLLYSIGYDRLILKNNKPQGSLSISGMFFYSGGDATVHFGTCSSYNFLFGKKSSFLELGAGLSFLRFNKYYSPWHSGMEYRHIDSFLSFSPRVGVRIQKPQGGFFFRFSITPFIPILNHYVQPPYPDYEEYFTSALGTDWPVLPWVGITIGKTSKK